MIWKAKDYEPEDAEEGKRKARLQQALSRTLNVRDALVNGPPTIEWRIQNILPERGVLFIGAPAGSYKTYLAQDLGLCVAAGKPWLQKFETEPCGVLYVDEENGSVLLLRRFAQLKRGHEILDIPERLDMTSFAGIKLDTEDGMSVLRGLIESYDASVVILDSMVRIMQGEEDKASQVRIAFDNLKDLLEERGTSFIILHHTRKAQRGVKNGMDALRGSGDFAAFADVVLMVTPSHAGSFRISMPKNRHIDISELQDFKIDVSTEGEEAVHFGHGGFSPREKSRTQEYQEAIIEWASKNEVETFLTKDLITHLKTQGLTTRQGVYDALHEFERHQQIIKVERGRYQVVKGRLYVQEEVIQ